eukprot:COSAG06_NODE_1282_length_10016_cov_230.231118_2_plen_201_part_00
MAEDPMAEAMERMEGVVSQLVEQVSMLQQRVELLTDVSKEVLLSLTPSSSYEEEEQQQQGQSDQDEAAIERRGFAPYRGQTVGGPRRRQEQERGGTAIDWEQQDKAAAVAAGMQQQAAVGWEQEEGFENTAAAPAEQPRQQQLEEGEDNQQRLVQLEDGSWATAVAPLPPPVAALPQRTFATFRGQRKGKKPQPKARPKL